MKDRIDDDDVDMVSPLPPARHGEPSGDARHDVGTINQSLVLPKHGKPKKTSKNNKKKKSTTKEDAAPNKRSNNHKHNPEQEPPPVTPASPASAKKRRKTNTKPILSDEKQGDGGVEAPPDSPLHKKEPKSNNQSKKASSTSSATVKKEKKKKPPKHHQKDAPLQLATAATTRMEEAPSSATSDKDVPAKDKQMSKLALVATTNKARPNAPSFVDSEQQETNATSRNQHETTWRQRRRHAAQDDELDEDPRSSSDDDSDRPGAFHEGFRRNINSSDGENEDDHFLENNQTPAAGEAREAHHRDDATEDETLMVVAELAQEPDELVHAMVEERLEEERQKQVVAQAYVEQRVFGFPRRMVIFGLAVMVMVLVLTVSLGVSLTGGSADVDPVSLAPSLPPSHMPTMTPTISFAPTRSRYGIVRDVLEEANVSSTALEDPLSPQYQSLEWLVGKDVYWEAVDLQTVGAKQLLERFVHALVYFATHGESSWTEQMGFLSNSSSCDWGGISCNNVVSTDDLDLGK
jgi:hypothetical protein